MSLKPSFSSLACWCLLAMGEREPVTTDCKGEARTTALIACLQPDRRVTVDILGETR